MDVFIDFFFFFHQNSHFWFGVDEAQDEDKNAWETLVLKDGIDFCHHFKHHYVQNVSLHRRYS